MNTAAVQHLLAQANGLLMQRQYPVAVQWYRQALSIIPQLPDAWFNLGYALRQIGAFEEALAAYEQALVYGAAGPEQIHLNRAVIFSDHLRDDAAAERELRAALARAPQYAPAWLNLGNLYEELGQRDAAARCYETLRAMQPAPSGGEALEALARLAQLFPPISADDPLFLELQAAATSTTPLDGRLRANLCFALGRALDHLGATPQAFAAFATGQRLAHRGAPPYDPAAAELHTQRLKQAFPSPAPGGTVALRTPQPLFICGMFRSGSTLLEQVLSMHPQVVAGGELELLPRMVAQELAPFPQSLERWSSQQLQTLADRYLQQARQGLPARSEQPRYFTDKRPDNFQLIGLIQRLFPGARVIYTQRHPLDNALSVYMQHLNPKAFPYASDLRHIAHHLAQVEALMAHWQALYPERIYRFDYDRFVADPEGSVRPLLAFLGLDWDARCLDFHLQGNTVKSASYWQVRRPLYAEASGRWQRYRSILEPVLGVPEAEAPGQG